VRRSRLVLVRHGESEWNAAGIIQGHLGPGLTPRGRTQAEVTADLLVRAHGRPVLLARSDLPRVVETAAPSQERFAEVPVVVDRRLREVDLGSWSGLTHEQVVASDPDLLAAFQRGEDVRRGGGETFVEVRERMVAVLDDLSDRAAGGVVFVFTHGGPIRVAVGAALRLPQARETVLAPVANASVSVLDWARGGARLVSYNDEGHLDGLATAGAVDDRDPA
jgi:probable phosphoglycerate mutase